MNFIEKLGITSIQVYYGENYTYFDGDEVKELEQQRNESIENLHDSCELICKLCVRLNPQHENCNHCDELDELRKPIMGKTDLSWEGIKELLND